MRSRRTDRLELKRTLARLEAENAELRARLTEPASETAAKPPEILQFGDAKSEQHAAAPALSAGGYPTRAAPLKAKTLKEAKEILMNSVDW